MRDSGRAVERLLSGAAMDLLTVRDLKRVQRHSDLSTVQGLLGETLAQAPWRPRDVVGGRQRLLGFAEDFPDKRRHGEAHKGNPREQVEDQQ